MVKCQDCGFLTLKIRETGELIEADSTYRETGGDTNQFNSVNGVYEAPSLCFVRAADFEGEWGANGNLWHIRLRIISQDRTCSQFTEWHQGFSPKDDAEMLHQKELIERQAELERERDERLHKWRQEDVALEKDAMKVTIRSYIVAAAIGFAGALSAVSLSKWLG